MTLTPSRAISTRKRIRRTGTVATIPEIERRMAAAADLQASIQRLETELLAHREWLLDYLRNSTERKATLGGFTASLRVRHNWEYSPRTAREMLALRNLQQHEQRAGIAVDTPTEYVALTFKPLRPPCPKQVDP